MLRGLAPHAGLAGAWEATEQPKQAPPAHPPPADVHRALEALLTGRAAGPWVPVLAAARSPAVARSVDLLDLYSAFCATVGTPSGQPRAMPGNIEALSAQGMCDRRTGGAAGRVQRGNRSVCIGCGAALCIGPAGPVPPPFCAHAGASGQTGWIAFLMPCTLLVVNDSLHSGRGKGTGAHICPSTACGCAVALATLQGVDLPGGSTALLKH